MQDVYQENKKRNQVLDAPYNPIKGMGGLIERFEFNITDDISVHIPVTMKQEKLIMDAIEHGTLEKFVLTKWGEHAFEDAFMLFTEIRYKHDFEFWAYKLIKIKPKGGGDLIPFKLNRPQRRTLAKLERMRKAGVPIRMIILKARQWGGSTLVQIYMAWIQILHKTNWNSLIAAMLNQQATNIRYMYTTLAKHYDGIELKPFENMVNVKIMPERSNKITIGSMQSPDSIRSDDIAMAHLSEVALWKKTEGKEPKDLAQSILGSIDSMPYTVYVLESTAKGVGNYFHNTYNDAVNGNNNLDHIFIPWFEIEQYRTKTMSRGEANKFYDRLNDYEKYLWSIGATLEGIKWYRYKLKEFGGDTWRMRSEFPSSAEEAFQNTGRRVYPPNIVEQARVNCSKPMYMGQLFANSDKGKEALKKIRFEETPNGDFWIWDLPDNSINVSNRYLVSVDIGGKSKDADWSVIRVLDRYWMIHGGVPEFVATLRIHIDNDLLAWLAVQVGTYYNNAMVVFENNSLKKYKNDDEDGFSTILNEIADYYDNLYIQSSNRDVVKQGVPIKYGFHTNRSSKKMLIDNKLAAMRDDGYIERDSRACDESDTYEKKPDGTFGANEGCHDDIEMSTNIGLWVSTFDMDPPRIINPEAMKAFKQKSKSRIKNEATF